MKSNLLPLFALPALVATIAAAPTDPPPAHEPVPSLPRKMPRGAVTPTVDEQKPKSDPAPAPELELPPPRRVPGATAMPNVSELKRQLEEMQSAREALRASMKSTSSEAPSREPGEVGDELARLRERLHELLTQLAARPTARARPDSVAPKKDSSAPLPPSPSASDTPRAPEPRPMNSPKLPDIPQQEIAPANETLDPLALGNSLFSLGDFESALRAYRQINLSSLQIEELAPVRYLIATCLRRLGKNDEAANLYREIASSKGDEFFADCAQWQLSAMRWRQELESHIEEVRRKRQSLEPKP